MKTIYFIMGSNGFTKNFIVMNHQKLGFILSAVNMTDSQENAIEECDLFIKKFGELASYQKTAVISCAMSLSDSVADFEERKNSLSIILGLLKIDL